MKRLKNSLRSYFNFSGRETNGFLLLLFITVLAIAAPFLFNKINQPKSYNPLKDQLALDSLAAQLDQAAPAESYAAKEPPGVPPANAPIRLHRFNPNTATQQELMALGISRYAAGNIVKYRTKAGGFRHKEQLKRIYGLPEALYQQLYAYIDLPAQETTRKNFNPPDRAGSPPNSSRPNKPERNNYRLQPFDINTADTAELKKIRGIGSKLSARIVNFRNKLGGFAHPGQLAEVYGLSPEVVDSLHKYTFIQADYAPRALALNTATLEELRAHPYVGFKLARLIIAYRTQHGAFRTPEDLKNIKLITEETYQKLKPYLGL